MGKNKLKWVDANGSRQIALITCMMLGVLGAADVAQSRTLKLDQTRGEVVFHATGHPSAIKIIGHGKPAHGQIKIEGATASGVLTFEVASLDTGIELRTRHMKEKYLEVGKYPESSIRFAALPLAQGAAAGTAYHEVPFSGVFTLHGVEKPISGAFSAQFTGATPQPATVTEFQAHFQIKVSDFGVEVPTYLGITMADQVDIQVSGFAIESANESGNESDKAQR